MTITDTTDVSLPTLPTLVAWRANVDTHDGRLHELIGEKGIADFVESTHVLEAFWKNETLGYGTLAAVKPRSRDIPPLARRTLANPHDPTTNNNDTDPKGLSACNQDMSRCTRHHRVPRPHRQECGWMDDGPACGATVSGSTRSKRPSSRLLEDGFGADPFSAGGDLPKTMGDVVAFYAPSGPNDRPARGRGR